MLNGSATAMRNWKLMKREGLKNMNTETISNLKYHSRAYYETLKPTHRIIKEDPYFKVVET